MLGKYFKNAKIIGTRIRITGFAKKTLTFTTNFTTNSVVTDHFKRHRETDPKSEVDIL